MRLGVSFAVALALTSALGSGGITVSAAEEPACPEGDGWLECRAKAGDRMAIYVLGRNAYETARESGDFSEALRLSRELAVTGDKNGERLLKMTQMQLGWGAHKDYVQAYVWLTEAIAGGSDYLVKWRAMLMEKMTPAQLAKAKELAGD